MPFIGQNPSVGAYNILDDITIGSNTNGPFNLLLNGVAFKPESANHLLVSLNGVIQKPGSSFTVSGSQITFVTSSGTLTTSDSIDFIMVLGNVLDVGAPSDGTISENKIATNAVTSNKIASNAVTMNKLATSGTLPALNGSALTGMGMTLVGYYSPSTAITNFEISLSATAHDYYKIIGFLNNDTSGVNTRAQFLDSNGTLVIGASDYHFSRLKVENSAVGDETNNDEGNMKLTALVGHNTGNRKGVGIEMLVGPTNSTAFPVQLQGMATLHGENSEISLNMFGGGYMEPATTFGGIRLNFTGGAQVEADSFLYVYGMNKT